VPRGQNRGSIVISNGYISTGVAPSFPESAIVEKLQEDFRRI
jgi:hypothetical protein